MRRIGDEDLILYYYSEAGTAQQEIERQLESSIELRQRYETLRRLLDMVAASPVPECPPSYGSRVWHRIAPRMETDKGAPSWSWWRPRRQWMWTAAALVLLVLAFVAGRSMPRGGDVEVAGLSPEGRERILLMTVAGHLERSEMLLLELVNTRDNGAVDLTLERRLADELGQDSQLFRQAARQAGRADVAALLTQLEVVLSEISHAPDEISAADLGELRVRLEEGDVLFKVRVLGSRLRQQVLAKDGARTTGPKAHEI